jgi:hypothetical protein
VAAGAQDRRNIGGYRNDALRPISFGEQCAQADRGIQVNLPSAA